MRAGRCPRPADAVALSSSPLRIQRRLPPREDFTPRRPAHAGRQRFGVPRGAPRRRTARTRAHAPPRGRVRVRLWAPCLQAAAPLGNGCREDWLQVKATWWGPGTRQAPHRRPVIISGVGAAGPRAATWRPPRRAEGSSAPPPPHRCHGWVREGRGAPCVWGPATLSGAQPPLTLQATPAAHSPAGRDKGPAPTELPLSGGQSAKTASRQTA